MPPEKTHSGGTGKQAEPAAALSGASPVRHGAAGVSCEACTDRYPLWLLVRDAVENDGRIGDAWLKDARNVLRFGTFDPPPQSATAPVAAEKTDSDRQQQPGEMTGAPMAMRRGEHGEPSRAVVGPGNLSQEQQASPEHEGRAGAGASGHGKTAMGNRALQPGQDRPADVLISIAGAQP